MTHCVHTDKTNIPYIISRPPMLMTLYGRPCLSMNEMNYAFATNTKHYMTKFVVIFYFWNFYSRRHFGRYHLRFQLG